MSEQPAVVAREAKGIHQSLKELLKSKEPFDKEVDFQRKNLRRRYLNLLLVHPNSKESKDAENHLWMQTSYAFIASYKQRITTLDRAIQNNQRNHQQQPSQHGGPGGSPHNNRTNPNHGVVEHRKLIQRFRQFLAEEEKFWTQLVLRLLRLFDLQEATPALVSLGLLNEGDEVAVQADLEVRDGVVHGANGRNHFQFPAEDPSILFVPSTAEERDARLATLSKALICLGDIARYRELYNESNGRPRAGHEDATPARRGRRGRGGPPETVARPRNYEKAQQCYEQARLLVPYEGNPSHQLAILASYQKDSFASLIHYYRALCVRQPYDTASENLGTVLSKALESYRQRMRREKEKEKNGSNEAQLAPRVRIEQFKERVVVLHALWRVGVDKGIEKMRSISHKHNERVASEFYSLVSERHLPIDMISNTVVLSHGALWKHRMIRDSSPSNRKSDTTPPIPASTPHLIEWALLDHILDLHLALLEVGKEELKDPPQIDDANDLAQRISATFRRTLPALRIASKWLRANFKYVAQDQEFVAYQEKQKLKGLEVLKSNPNKISQFSVKTRQFWMVYASFTLALSQAFPETKLPKFNPLEEDVEMRGYLPLRGLMGENKSAQGEKAAFGQAREQVHPNVEQLMRIADLLDDAKAISNMENSPLDLKNSHFIFKLESIERDARAAIHVEAAQLGQESGVPIRQQQLLVDIRDHSLDLQPVGDAEEDGMTEGTSRTDDDPVRDAFKHLNTEENSVADDDEDDRVVYMRSNSSPITSPMQGSPVTPVKAILSPKTLSPRSPTYFGAHNKAPSFSLKNNMPPVASAAPATTTTVTTAQDLLNDVMLGGVGRPVQPALPSESSAPQPKFLFGEVAHHNNQSIWAASRDEHSLLYTSTNGANGAVGHNPAANPPLSHNMLGGNHLAGSALHMSAGLQHSAGGMHSSLPSLGAGGQIYQTAPRQFSGAAGGSQDLSLSQPSIWSSSFSQSQNSQQPLVSNALPGASYAHPPQIGLGGSPSSSLLLSSPRRSNTHQRIPSLGASTHLFANNSPNADLSAYTSPLLQQQQAVRHRPDGNFSASSSGYLSSSIGQSNGPLSFGVSSMSSSGLGMNGGMGSSGLGIASMNTNQGAAYYSSIPNVQSGSNYHSRQVSMNDPRVMGQSAFMSPALSQTWGSPG